MKKTLQNIIFSSIALGLILAAFAITRQVYADTTVVVTPANMSGWWFFQETPSGSGTIVYGPATPPLGSGSVRLTVNATGGEIFGTFAFVGTRLDSITSLVYSTYRDSGSSALAPSIQLDIDTDVTDAITSWQGRLVYEPYYTHTVTTGAWQTWNPLDNAGTGNWWFTGAPGNTVCTIGNPCTWAELLAAFPNAGIRSAGANTGATQFKAGAGWASGFVGSVDALSVGVNGVITTYDFELSPASYTITPLGVDLYDLDITNCQPGDHSWELITQAQSLSLVSPFFVDLRGCVEPHGKYTFSELNGSFLGIANEGQMLSCEGFEDSEWSFSCMNDHGWNNLSLLSVDPFVPPASPTADPPPHTTPSTGGGGSSSGYTYFAPLPLINITNIPSPLTLPSGFGLVTYTYTVTNLGIVAMNGVWVKDDKCDSLKFISGDNDGDASLDVSEAWLYSCTKTVTQTETNIATVHGSANGWDGYDIAIATVAVPIPGLPETGLPAPLIKIVTAPSRLIPFPVGGGDITYTYTVTNPGVVDIDKVVVNDNKCSPVSDSSGDANGDTLLNPGEAWVYYCKENILASMVDIVTVGGRGNNFIALDHALTNVSVATPAFPNTGSPQSVRDIAVNLSVGSRGSNVALLQRFLISQNKGVAAQDLANVGVTAYFGGLTRSALAEFQAKVGIVPALGNFGPITRSYIKSHY